MLQKTKWFLAWKKMLHSKNVKMGYLKKKNSIFLTEWICQGKYAAMGSFHFDGSVFPIENISLKKKKDSDLM